MMLLVVVLVVAALGRPVALTLALSRRAGEGTVVVGGGVAVMGVGCCSAGVLSEPRITLIFADGLGWVAVGGHPCSIGGAGLDVRIWREG